MGRKWSTISSYIVARVTTAIVKDGPNSIDFATGRRNLKKLARYPWYNELQAQYKESWHLHPAMIELASHIDFEALDDEQAVARLIDSITGQLAILHWEKRDT